MPTGATTGATIDGNAGKRETVNKEAPTIPFVRASFRHHQPVQTVTRTLTAATQDAGVVELTSYGYVRAVVLKVRATGSNDVGPNAAFSADGPYNVLQDIVLSEPNGATIFAINDGYRAMLTNKFGGYRGRNDPRATAIETDETEGNFEFTIRIPIEISERDALGALPNQNAASSFQVRFKIAPSTTVYSVVPDVALPTITVDVSLEAWAQPTPNNPHGGMNETTPPALNTTQYWSEQQYSVVSGLNRIRLNRVGNYLRNLLFIFTDTAGATRATGDSMWPDDFKLWLDSTPVELNVTRQLWIERQYERYSYRGTADAFHGRENSVWPYDFCHEFDGNVGHELRDSWLLTNTSSRLEIEGTFGGAGTLRVLTNDVTVAGNVFL